MCLQKALSGNIKMSAPKMSAPSVGTEQPPCAGHSERRRDGNELPGSASRLFSFSLSELQRHLLRDAALNTPSNGDPAIIFQNSPVHFFQSTKKRTCPFIYVFVHLFVISAPPPTECKLHDGRDLSVSLTSVAGTYTASVCISISPEPQNSHSFARY